MSQNTPYPRSLSHIGISVPDLEQAVNFYRQVMGWYVVMPPAVINEDEDKNTVMGQMCLDIFGKGFKQIKIAHLSTVEKIGIELFEFANNTGEKAKFTPAKTGIFHFAVQDPDIEGLVQKIIEFGGKQHTPIREYHLGKEPYKMVYMEDPFGNIIEISRPYNFVHGDN